MPQNKAKTKEQVLVAKREAEKKRYNKIKNDPVKYEQQKLKEKLKYLKKKEKKLVKPISEMTSREKRAKRKAWRNNSKNYRENKKKKETVVKNFLRAHSPPDSDNENGSNTPDLEPIASPEPAALQLREKVRKDKLLATRNRKRYSLALKEKDNIIRILRSKKEMYKKRYYRLKATRKPRCDVNEMVSDSEISLSPASTKNILFGKVLRDQLVYNFTSMKSDQERQMFTKVISGKIIKKYRMQNQCSRFLKYKRTSKDYINTSPLTYSRKDRFDTVKNRKSVQEFLELDINSRICPGKREFVRKGKMSKQKRYLNDTLKNLHKKFLKEYPNSILSYATFCTYCPFWIQQMSVSNRETCKCIHHANFEFLVDSLFNNNVLNEKKPGDVIRSICCRKEARCLLRMCDLCKVFKVTFKDFVSTEPTYYFKWGCTKETYFDKRSNQNKTVTRNLKQKIECQLQDIVRTFEKQLPLFLNHEGTNMHQFNEIQNLKENLKENDVLIHMDFSENYNLKYAEEVQSFHFGGSRKQITLHTVVVYTKCENGTPKVESFCTLSESLLHNVFAIWTHLQPILDRIALTTKATNIHFLSDGPATQYRNKTMFYFLANELREFYPQMKSFTWNYSESGHGKGAPDGIGGTVKRTADRLVAQGTDLMNLNILLQKLENNCPGIIFFEIKNIDIEAKLKKIENVNILPFPGTIKVHQVCGNQLSSRLKMKSLSCFGCEDCHHFELGIVDYHQQRTRLNSFSSHESLAIHTSKAWKYEDVYNSSEDESDSVQKVQSLKAGTFILFNLAEGDNDKKQFR